MRLRERRRDDQVSISVKSSHGKVCFDSPLGVQELGVHDFADWNCEIIRRQAVQHAFCVASLHQNFCERTLLEHPDPFPDCAMFFGVIVEPVLTTPGIVVFSFLSGSRVPVRTFPAGRFTKACADGREAIMQNTFLNSACCGPLPKRPVILVADTK